MEISTMDTLIYFKTSRWFVWDLEAHFSDFFFLTISDGLSINQKTISFNCFSFLTLTLPFPSSLPLLLIEITPHIHTSLHTYTCIRICIHNQNIYNYFLSIYIKIISSYWYHQFQSNTEEFIMSFYLSMFITSFYDNEKPGSHVLQYCCLFAWTQNTQKVVFRILNPSFCEEEI